MESSQQEQTATIAAARRAYGSVATALHNVGAVWAVYGRKAGKAALIASAKTLSTAAKTLSTIASDLGVIASDLANAPPRSGTPPS